MPRLIFVANGAMLDDGGECSRVLWKLLAQAGGTRDSWAFAVQERAVSLLNAWTGEVTMTSAGGLEPTRGGATLASMGQASTHITSRHPSRRVPWRGPGMLPGGDAPDVGRCRGCCP